MTVMVSPNRTFLTIRFWLRIFALATVTAPVLAGDSNASIGANTDPALAALTVPHHPLSVPIPEPLDEALVDVGSTSAQETPIETFLVPSEEALEVPQEIQFPTGYWIASSRRSVQTIHHKNQPAWGLDVYHAPGCGRLDCLNLQSLTTQLIPGIPVCIFSHGSFVTWESQSQQAARAAAYFRSAAGDRPLQLIFFTWPSDGPYTMIAPIDVSVRGKRAEFNGFHMATLISAIPESCPVTIIGHSHGSRVALAAMQLASGGSVQDHYFTGTVGNCRRLRVILAAGAMDHNWLNPGERYGYALNRVECLLNLRNQHDPALAWYPLTRPFAKRAIARSGLTSRDVQTLGYNAQKVRQVDITCNVGHSHQWPEYYSNPTVLATILPYLVSF